MNYCKFENYFIEYVSGQMEISEKLRFQLHLEECPTCPNKLDEFYSVHQKIDSRIRPNPQKSFLNEYHNSNSQLFFDDSKKNVFINKVNQLFEFLFRTKSYRIRVAEIVGFILIGVAVGWLLFIPAEKLESDDYVESQLFSKPISLSELDYINYYFQAAELLLLEIINIDQSISMASAEFEFNRTIAQKLLIKTFIIHEIALRHKDPQILRFLSKMEILLYEISNFEGEELKSSMATFNLIIDDTNLINEARQFQKRLTKFRNPKRKNGTINNPFLYKEDKEY